MGRRHSGRAEIPPFYVMEVMRAAERRLAAGEEVLHLEVGQPSTAAPAGAREAAHRAIDGDVLGYTTAAGLEPLRVRIAQHYDEWYGVGVDPDAVVLTVGASGAFVVAFLSAFDAGDRVVVPSPGYPCYRNALGALGVDVIDLPTTIDTRFQPTIQQLDAVGPADGLVVGSPSNPTGTMLDAERLDGVARWCREHDAWFVSDEIYHGITFAGAAPTALTYDPDAIVINSFSKYYSMTGWRLGWMVVPDRLRDAATRVAQNVTIAAPTVAQHAALAAFDCTEELEANVERYAHNRVILLDGLRAAGFTELAPADGAFYVWARVDHLTGDREGVADSQALCARWLDELGVATTPGVDFDPTHGHRFVRFSFAGSSDDISAAVQRLGEWVVRR
jgi:aspartate/methionine/tyrosine aminotransferase